MLEELFCTDCQRPWFRTFKTGAKPKFCPPCAAESIRLSKSRYNKSGKGHAAQSRYMANPEKRVSQRRLQREWALSHPEARSRHKRKYRDGPGGDVERKWKANNPEKVAAIRRRANLRRYGMTERSFMALLESQQGRCAICRTDEPVGGQWHVDHDHSCCGPDRACDLCRRGLLCGKCNPGLGQFDDDVERLARAISYLTAHQAASPRHLSSI